MGNNDARAPASRGGTNQPAAFRRLIEATKAANPAGTAPFALELGPQTPSTSRRLRRMQWILSVTVMLLAQWAAVLGRLFADNPDATPLNIPMPTMGGVQFWSDELFFHGWHIQRNALTSHYRLLDSKNTRVAWGTLTDCRAALERIKRERHLPPMRGRAVILLHGLFRSSTSMEKMAKYLHDEGRYSVFCVSYPSTQSGASEHAKSLARIIANLDGIEEINFVAHSMGNIVVRHYLADHEQRPDPRLRRMVMLGPPNHGSLAAVVLSENSLFKTLTGQAGQELGAQWESLEKNLATPTFEFGIVAGGKGDGRGYNPLLPGDNDATISVETTRLNGAADSIVVPVLHSFLMDSSEVQECTLRFLKYGYFVAANKRHPLDDN